MDRRHRRAGASGGGARSGDIGARTLRAGQLPCRAARPGRRLDGTPSPRFGEGFLAEIPMTPADLERAGTWLIEIVNTLIEDVRWRQEGDEHHAVGQGGLSINTRKGGWYQHST